jgi:hypothetical protein
MPCWRKPGSAGSFNIEFHRNGLELVDHPVGVLQDAQYISPVLGNQHPRVEPEADFPPEFIAAGLPRLELLQVNLEIFHGPP